MKITARCSGKSVRIAATTIILLIAGLAGSRFDASAQELIMGRTNSVGDWNAMMINNGTVFHNPGGIRQGGVAGGLWLTPGGDLDTLIFGGGLWFGGIRNRNGAPEPHVEFAYNPNLTGSNFIPGSIIYDGAAIDSSPSARNKYRVYRSTDNFGLAWPVRSVGGSAAYVDDVALRLSTGPAATIGDEDVFMIYKDSDPAHADASFTDPFGFEVRTQVGFWRSGALKDVAIVKNQIINTSQDTIFDPVLGLVIDGDVQSPGDDRLKSTRSESVSPAIFFTDNSTVDPLLGVMLLSGEGGRGRDNAGLTSLRYWDITEDPTTDSERYQFLIENRRDTATSHIGDARLIITSLSHTPVMPGDTIYLDYCVYGRPGSGAPALSPQDSGAMVATAEEIMLKYRSGQLKSEVRHPGISSQSLLPYPNPAVDRLTVPLLPGEDGIEVSDALGRHILSVPCEGKSEVTIDVRGLPGGAYRVKMERSGRSVMVLLK